MTSPTPGSAPPAGESAAPHPSQPWPTALRGWPRVVELAENAGPGAKFAVAARAVGTDRVWEINGTIPFPAASTIKTAILVALHRAFDASLLRPDQELPLTMASKTPGSGVLALLRDGLPLTLADLATLMIAISDNTASNLILDAVGLDRVRAVIADLGLTGTQLNRRFLGRAPAPSDPDNVTVARDLTALLAAIADGTAASDTACARMRATLAHQQDRDGLARYLPAEASFAGKSGSLPALAHDTGLLATPAGFLAVAVLTRGIADPHAARERIGRIALALVDSV